MLNGGLVVNVEKPFPWGIVSAEGDEVDGKRVVANPFVGQIGTADDLFAVGLGQLRGKGSDNRFVPDVAPGHHAVEQTEIGASEGPIAF